FLDRDRVIRLEREREIAEEIGVDIRLKVDLGLVDRGASCAWASVVAKGESPDEIVVWVLAEGPQLPIQDHPDRRVKRANQRGWAARCSGSRWRQDGLWSGGDGWRLLETRICHGLGRRRGWGRVWRRRRRHRRRSLARCRRRPWRGSLVRRCGRGLDLLFE